MRKLIVLMLIMLLGMPLLASAGQPVSSPPAATSVQAPAASVNTPIPVPQPSAEAVEYYKSGNLLWIVNTIWGFLIPGLILFTGFSATMRNWAQKLGKYWYFTLVLYFVIFSLITFAIDFPLDYYTGFIRPHDYGLSSQAFGKWLSDDFKGLAIGLVMGALLLWIPYLLLKRATKRWWLYTWLASIPVMVFLMLVQPIWIAPMFNKFGPMQDKALEAKILHLADRVGIENARVYEVNKSVDTNELNAYVTGIGSTKRIVLWDTIIKKLTPGELLVVMGHEMGHYVLNHIWYTLIFGSLFLLLGLWLIHLTAGWVLRRFGGRFGFNQLGDIASLPLLILMFSLFSFVMSPVALAYSRHHEHEADRFALEITQDNHDCAQAFVDLTNNDLGYPRPGLLYKLWRSSHPPLGERIDFCNSYHPWTENLPLKYGKYFQNDTQR